MTVYCFQPLQSHLQHGDKYTFKTCELQSLLWLSWITTDQQVVSCIVSDTSHWAADLCRSTHNRTRAIQNATAVTKPVHPALVARRNGHAECPMTGSGLVNHGLARYSAIDGEGRGRMHVCFAKRQTRNCTQAARRNPELSLNIKTRQLR